jgi:uncharacterized protein YicC (UPF0701 family)
MRSVNQRYLENVFPYAGTVPQPGPVVRERIRTRLTRKWNVIAFEPDASAQGELI